MKYEFNGLCNIISIKGKSPIEYTNELISEIDSMLEHIKFCVIITGNENDAYTLFEVLNDRALDIEDLDLICFINGIVTIQRKMMIQLMSVQKKWMKFGLKKYLLQLQEKTELR